MLSPADADLARRDPALPGLALVLDEEALRARLRRAWPTAELVSLRARYVRYKPHTNCLVAFEARESRGTVSLYAKAHGPGAAPKLSKARQRPAAAPAGVPRAAFEDEGVVVCAFPSDDKLPALRLLASDTSRRRLLARVLPEVGSGPADLAVLRYKPERRLVARLTSPAGVCAVLRFLLPGDLSRSRRAAKTIRSRGRLLVPRPLGRSRRHGVLALEWLEGRPLPESLAGGAHVVERVAEALAELHGQPADALPTRGPVEEAEAVLAAARALAHLSPRLAASAESLAGALAERLAEGPARPVTIHGDFYASQCLAGADAVAVLDLDEAARGEAAADLGSFLAHLHRDELAGRIADGAAAAWGEALVERYRELRPLRGDRRWVHAAAALLRLATHPFRDRETDWPDRAEQIVERARRLLGQASAPIPRRQRPTLACSRTPVTDPTDAAHDPGMPFLAAALEPPTAERRLLETARLRQAAPGASLRAVRVRRHKPGRRCLIEYELGSESTPSFCVMGKARARGLDGTTWHVVRQLWSGAFGPGAADGLRVPEPLGTVPEWSMWLQARARGVAATELLGRPGGALAGRIAEAAHKLHSARLSLGRHHGVEDELRILEQGLDALARSRPAWAHRLSALMDACRRRAARLSSAAPAVLHRDFYADHVVVDGPLLHLVDFDLCCWGDPALDVGNFVGHLIEQGLRDPAAAEALTEAAGALEQRYLELAGSAAAPAIRTYTDLTLARHVYLSVRFPERAHCTEALLETCEGRLGVGSGRTLAALGGGA